MSICECIVTKVDCNEQSIQDYGVCMSIDSPTANSTTHAMHLRMYGWMYSWKYTIYAVAIYSTLSPRFPVAVASLHEREDVAKHLGVSKSTCVSFDININLLGLDGESSLYILPIFSYTDFQLKKFPYLCDIYNKIVAKCDMVTEFQSTPNYSPICNPLFITSLGRSCSTILYKIIASSKNAIGCAEYPYEARVAAYYLKAMRILLTKLNLTEGHESETFLDNLNELLPNPFFNNTEYKKLDIFIDSPEYSMKIFENFRSIIQYNYEHLSSKYDYRYFIEKSVPATITSKLARRCWSNVKEVVLIRNPKRWITSAYNFWGHNPKSLLCQGERFSHAECFIKMHRNFVMLADYIQQNKDHIFVLRHEDIVTGDKNAISSLKSYLSIDDIDFSLLSRPVAPNHMSKQLLDKGSGDTCFPSYINNLLDNLISTHFNAYYSECDAFVESV